MYFIHRSLILHENDYGLPVIAGEGFTDSRLNQEAPSKPTRGKANSNEVQNRLPDHDSVLPPVPML
jgi:hypothetical protein